jgi:hypothetical protein
MEVRKGNRKGPDIPALVAKYPRRCVVRYRGKTYKLMRCALKSCGLHFWRSYMGRDGKVTATTNPKRTYCGDACAREGRRELTRLRQKRYRNHPANAAAFRQRQNLKARRRRALARGYSADDLVVEAGRA